MRDALTAFGLAADIQRVDIEALGGGRFFFSDMREEGEARHWGIYKVLERPRKIEFTRFTSEEEERQGSSVVRIEITPHRSGCSVVLTHSMDAAYKDYLDQTAHGWETMLKGIDARVRADDRLISLSPIGPDRAKIEPRLVRTNMSQAANSDYSRRREGTEQMSGRAAIWKRLDVDGMDACRYLSGDGGWTTEGTALFAADEGIANLSYRLFCDGEWVSTGAQVEGWIGAAFFSLRLRRMPEFGWLANNKRLEAVSGLLDIDLGFTPASNTNAIRRLTPGKETVETTAVWLDTADWTIKPLPQTYERLTATTFAYSSPTHEYSAVLEIDAFGVVTRYPGLWEAIRVDPF